MSITYKQCTIRSEEKVLLRRVNWTLEPGCVYGLMGPNGAGKSSLAQATIGHPNYQVSAGGIYLDQTKINDWSMAERALSGLFLAWQAPVELPVKMIQFLKTIWENQCKKKNEKCPTAAQILTRLKDLMQQVGLPERLLYQPLYQNASGGERKRGELLQALLLMPRLAIFDEIDSGIDAEGLKLIGEVVKTLQAQGSAILLITHNPDLRSYVDFDQVAILQNGQITHTGSEQLMDEVAREGYRLAQQ